MAPELGGSQISALLESVPGIAKVLRSPVADALVNVLRAAAGLADLRPGDAEELLQYAVRRGLISADECAHVLAEVQEAAAKPARRSPASSPARPKVRAKAKEKSKAKAKAAKTSRARPVKKAARRR